ncbi:hypothetical protein ACFL6S_19480 [Candidatus Poribacteria bacterium]
MTTIHWLIISIFLFDTGYYIGRWVGCSQERGKALRAKLFGVETDRYPSMLGKPAQKGDRQ